MACVCSICEIEPKSHSFIHIPNEGAIQIFYSCPAIATKYNDTAGIIQHVDKTLEHFECHRKPWKWIFDADNFGWVHAMELQTAMGLAELITTKYGEYLCAIHIVNANWLIRMVFTIISPLLSERIRNVTRFIDTPSEFQSNMVGENALLNGTLSRVTSMEFSYANGV